VALLTGDSLITNEVFLKSLLTHHGFEIQHKSRHRCGFSWQIHITAKKGGVYNGQITTSH
jgi:hypothetical protein